MAGCLAFRWSLRRRNDNLPVPLCPLGQVVQRLADECLAGRLFNCDSSCGLFGGGSSDIDEPYNPSKVEMTPLWRLFDRS